jgi:hypothetical protein
MILFKGGVGMKVRLLKCKVGHKTVALASYNPKLCEADIDFFVDSNGRMTRHKRCGNKLIVNRIVEGNGWVDHWNF